MMIEEDNTLITTRQLIFLRKYAIFRDVPLLHLRREQASTLIKGELASDPVTVAQLRYLFALGYRGEAPKSKYAANLAIRRIVDKQAENEFADVPF